MCRPTIWSHMHNPLLAIFQADLNFLLYVYARALVGVHVGELLGSPLNHHWKVNVKLAKLHEYMMQFVQTHP